MKNILIIFALALTLAACSSSNSSATETNVPATGDYIPRPGDSALTRGPVFLDSTDLLTMESFPLQFSLGLKGSVPTPCHQLRISANTPDPQNKIRLEVYSVTDPNMVCAQVLQPFDVNYSLGSYPTGHYILLVNGTQIAEFDA